MAAHLVVPLQKQKQEHELHEHGAWVGASQGILVSGGSWPMAWRSHGVAAGGTRATAAEDSWEVRAFAEDAASCSEQWPPRSYSCSFCAREFRTAQALGGHMNVHRRERAYANQLGLLRSSPNSPGASADASSCSASAAPASTPALGLCWLYPVPAAQHSAASNSLSCHQVSASTVTTATPLAMSRQSETKRTLGEAAAATSFSIDRKKMMLEIDPNVDLELRLGQAL